MAIEWNIDRDIRGGCSTRSADELIAELAAAQHGVVARVQLVARGVGPDAIDRRIAARRLHPIHRGVFAVGHRLRTREATWMAAVQAAGPDAVLGVPVGRRAVARSRQRKDRGDLAAQAAPPGDRGSPHPAPGRREEVELASRRTSASFERVLELIRRDDGGKVEELHRRWRAGRQVAGAAADRRMDGFATHGTRKAFEDDRALQVAGWRVVRLTWRQLATDGDEIARQLAILPGHWADRRG